MASDIHQTRDEDLQSLENVATREDSVLSMLSNGLAFRISSTPEILGMQTSQKHPAPVSEYDRGNESIVMFPEFKVAALLLQSYESSVDYIVRILHLPTVRSVIKPFYLRLNQGETVHIGQAALLLSIFALAAFFYEPSESSKVATNPQDHLHLSKVFCKGALDVLDFSRRNTSGTLEDVQAYIIMTVVTFYLDGFSARGRLLMMSATTIARDLGLHRLDAENEFFGQKTESVRDFIDREVKRRVFWFITSTDWFVLWSTVSGPQVGTYFIHPDHIHVKLPIDCNDDDLVLGERPELITEPRPTGMTYLLERIRLAHLCREIVDTVPLETSKLEQVPYDHIINLDKKLVGLISSLPFFFRLDAESRQRTKPLEIMYPNIPLLRYCITRAAHSRRCKLHQRFLLRQSSDPRYAFSRRACLESARAVIQFHEDLGGDGLPWIVAARMGIAVHFVHLALVVLIMDLCFNKDQADEAEIRAEVKATLQKFEDAKHVSPLLGRFLKSLCGIVRKHRIHPNESSDSALSNDPAQSSAPILDDFNPPGDDRWQPVQLGVDGQISGDALGTPTFDEFWDNAMQGEPELDLSVWNNLFSSLDSRPL
ncbi:hypothetical protein PV05_04889 [Exophiala xenobiotica]|uniref:Xylanolytic transcriptional activator regulatory domain-containing protein n=1 Tax=Exophiala xenobiotica TaxID=348802 RepID=A0A0D2BUP5_9EURO|nr:uncharacterized protein PV05_04889 [Exophiala xenobiotica]KIW56211.1 hypothetical protein PV05_04889 [Exophiala xenobiotica]